MNYLKRLNRTGDKYMIHSSYGRGKGQRPATGMFLYKTPKNQTEKNHNKETLKILEVKKGQQIIESQAVGTGYIPAHKLKPNFLDYYDEYVKNHKRKGNRHLECCFTRFKKFFKKDFLSPISISYDFCFLFRRYLLDCLTGETPQNYYATFKTVIKNATRDGYFKINPTEEIPAVRKPSTRLKDNLEVEDYLIMISTPAAPHLRETIEGFIFSCYTGLRWCDVAPLLWREIENGVLTTRIIQAKTGQPVTLTLHPIALQILSKKKRELGTRFNPDRKVFSFPSKNAANEVIASWVKTAGIKKRITWSCARLSYSILLQDKNVATATVAYLLGHTTTKQVESTYKRYRPKDQLEAISNLPMPDESPYFHDASQ